jgi:hypothetical protein
MTTMNMKMKHKPEPKSDISGTTARVTEDMELFRTGRWGQSRVKPKWCHRDGKPISKPVINMTVARQRKITATFNQKMTVGKVGAAMKIADKHFELCFKPAPKREHRPHEKADLPPPIVRAAAELVDEPLAVPLLNPVQRAAAVADGIARHAARRKAKELMAAGKIEQWMKFVSRNPISLS